MPEVVAAGPLTEVAEAQRGAIDAMKRPDRLSARPALPILAPGGVVAGRLRAVAPIDADDVDLVADLTSWRQRNMGYFLTRFQATPERTRHWLRRMAGDPCRVLFLVFDADDVRVGHYGLILRDRHTVEVDNAIIGMRPSDRRIMLHTEHALLAWAFGVLGVDLIDARLLNTNVTCFSMHRSTGFSAGEVLDLCEDVAPNGDRILRPLCDGEAALGEERLLTMQLRADGYWRARREAGYPDPGRSGAEGC